MSLTMTFLAVDANTTWPFITFNNFEAMGYEAIKHTGANFVGYTPLVKHEDRQAYEEYSYEHQEWIQRGLAYRGIDANIALYDRYIYCTDSSNSGNEIKVCEDADVYAPIAQMSPIEENYPNLNYNAFDLDFFTQSFNGMVEAHAAVLSHVLKLEEKAATERGWPVSFMAAPIYDKVEEIGTNGELVGSVTAEIPWHRYFLNMIPEGIDGIILVVQNTCDQEFSYTINGPNVDYLGPGDRHDPQFDNLEVMSEFTTFKSIPACQYSFYLYPSSEFKSEYMTSTPTTNAIGVAIVFVLTALVFVVYDTYVQRRQTRLLSSAEQTSAIVNSLFPENVRERLIGEAVKTQEANKKDSLTPFRRDPLDDKTDTAAQLDQRSIIQKTKPIADLFPNATVIFGDLVGFTAWSSVREPTQVFTLLETLYGAFDKIANRLGVFKVETIGDCYVATVGLPEPRADHAVVMARFARHCMVQLNEVVHDLEYTLGPGTAELALRIGIHSGPVIAGVLRGEKSRFQLFGDTMNTAARMESTGMKNKIQLSQQTADLLFSAGKESWVKARSDLVVAKGKGELQTYWLTPRNPSTKTCSVKSDDSDERRASCVAGGDIAVSLTTLVQEQALDALIGWNADFLQELLKKMTAMRGRILTDRDVNEIEKLRLESDPNQTILDEVKDYVILPQNPSNYAMDPETVELDPEVLAQLRDFVSKIASMNKAHAFHSFAHATHVCQSVRKLLSLMVAPGAIDDDAMADTNTRSVALHEATYGIASDPLTEFACVFAALILDVDHPGVSNDQLVKEESNLAVLYRNKSVSEQNSIAVAWGLLMEPSYKDLRACIYTSQSELERFRHIVVNAVLATGILDKERVTTQAARWEDAFRCQPESSAESQTRNTNRRATAVVENLMTASDFSHAMQHWDIYVKWNELLFDETYRAYLSGRCSNDPSQTWYEDELSLFKSRILPLAQSLRACGVFGAVSDEYMNYAEQNSREWEQKGKEMVEGYLFKFSRKASLQD
jgi:class 3 adenylate cyclase